jgi:tetratricopeptide (TPR) repeat protein
MNNQINIIISLLTIIILHAQNLEQAELNKWQDLFNNGHLVEAEYICQYWLINGSKADKIEACKCLANIFFQRSSSLILESDNQNIDKNRIRAAGAYIDSSILYLNKGLSLDPQDISMHQGRLHILLTSGFYKNAIKIAENSINTYDSDNEIDYWISYCPYYFDAGQYESGELFCKMLLKYFPNDHRIYANIGAFLTLQEKDDEALIYCNKAIRLNPKDPLNNWNLGRLYDYIGKIDSAKVYYEKSLSIDKEWSKKNNSYCLFAEFLEKNNIDIEKAKKLRKKYCEK